MSINDLATNKTFIAVIGNEPARTHTFMRTNFEDRLNYCAVLCKQCLGF